MSDRIHDYPTWLLLLIGYLLVVLVGSIDYLTGDYSMLIFYIIPIFYAGWVLGRGGALVVALGAGMARFVSDCNSYSGSAVRYWNSIQDTAFLMMVGILVATVKMLTNDDAQRPPSGKEGSQDPP